MSVVVRGWAGTGRGRDGDGDGRKELMFSSGVFDRCNMFEMFIRRK